MPGYWTAVQGGYGWTPGFWLSGFSGQLDYLPCPPAAPETGPVGQAPTPDSLWVPGCYYWEGGRYAWRPGVWEPARADWIWTPAHYMSTVRGCVFAPGYWDYPIERRGLLFAPVYFGSPVYDAPGFTYAPSVCIETAVLADNFFTRPGYCHYYFGDYYDRSFAAQGIYPSYQVRDRHDWDDPIFFRREWSGRRTDPQWDQHLRDQYARRESDRAPGQGRRAGQGTLIEADPRRLGGAWRIL